MSPTDANILIGLIILFVVGMSTLAAYLVATTGGANPLFRGRRR